MKLTTKLEMLSIEEADAWFEYLESTRGQTPKRYWEIEPWAWAHLNKRLDDVVKRRQELTMAS